MRRKKRKPRKYPHEITRAELGEFLIQSFYDRIPELTRDEGYEDLRLFFVSKLANKVLCQKPTRQPGK